MVPMELENSSAEIPSRSLLWVSGLISTDAIVIWRLGWSWRIHFQCGLYICWDTGAGCWLGSSFYFYTRLSMVLLEHNNSSWLAFHQAGSCSALYDLALKAIYCYLHCILSVAQSSTVSRWEGLHKDSKFQEVRVTQEPLEGLANIIRQWALNEKENQLLNWNKTFRKGSICLC